MKLKQEIEKIEKELLDIEPDDHNDLQKIMSTVDATKNVPEDMLLLWEQQRRS